MALGQYSGGFGAIAGGIIGGLIGSFYGQTYSGAMIGASLGGMAGGVAGAVLWPEKISAKYPPPPQPNENRQQISTYGSPIPIVYESSRLAGNIIYMQDVNQTVTRSKHRTDGVRYYEITNTYSSTFAIAFCEGPIIGIARIWVNGKIFVDFRDPNGDYYPTGSTSLATANLGTSVARSAVSFSIYFGTETQTYDASLAAILTAAETPAYRGTCYIVFIDFPVGEFSGVPTIEIEIAGVDDIVSGSPGINPVYDFTAISFSGWTEFDIGNDLTFDASNVTIVDAGNGALCSIYDIASFGNIKKFRCSFTITDLDGANYQEVVVLSIQDDAAVNILVSVNVGPTSYGVSLIGPVGNDAYNSGSITYPQTRYIELDLTTANQQTLKIYSDSSFTTLVDTLVISETMAASPAIAYIACGLISAADEVDRSPLDCSISNLTALYA